jgi:Ni/Co efflux regulator RcnB
VKVVVTALAVLALATPAAARVVPAFDQTSIIKVDHKGKHRGKGHGKKHRHYDDDRGYYEGYRDGRRQARRDYRDYDYGYDGYRPGYAQGYQQGYHHWSRGQVLPYEYRRHPIYNYDDYGWAPPPRGHAYYRTNTGDILLAAIATGIIVSIITR